jgi:hypothetical protein
VQLLSPIRPHFNAIANHRDGKSKAAAAELVEAAFFLSSHFLLRLHVTQSLYPMQLQLKLSYLN